MFIDTPGNDTTIMAEAVSLINGAYMAVADRGYKVNLVTSGLGCDTDNIAKEVERLVKVEKVVAIIGPVCSGTTLAAAPTVNALKVPAISPTAGAIAVSAAGPYVYRTIATVASYVNSLMDYLVPKYTGRMAMVVDDGLGADWAGLVDKYLAAHGGNVTFRGRFLAENGTAAQVEDLVKQAMATKPGFAFFMATSAIAPELEVAFIRTARAEDPRFPLVMPNGLDAVTKAALQVAAANGTQSYPLIDGIYLAGDVPTPKANDRYRSMFGLRYMPTLDGGAQSNTYDAMSAIIRAAQAVGHDHLSTLNKALAAKDFTFPRYAGDIGRFDANGDLAAEQQVQAFSGASGEPVPLTGTY
ncbi:hypothetical protein HXX76_016077 [Chlamydomonas incerta]|uniref:Leucine-binding protein domain-containing protein n=1 Tax=Chlamydomonas incerta TaxID=51695 RepID=A0A835SLX6_CHLIN|nr:hypothetical protein HXX76_016077 [Chlamydomonas incerta]|eukprot:KAG2422391.1 hypothetical protein HXX76_016077 [Chlamydomonas incerta]